MAWGKTKEGTKGDAEPGERSVAADLMDLAAGLLLDFGRTALDLEGLGAATLRLECEQWARHLLIGSPKPGAEAAAVPLAQRDLGGLRKFFAERRAFEMGSVGRSLQTLKEGVWSFVKALDGIVAQGDAADDDIRRRLDRLKQLVQDGSALELLRAEVVEAANEIGQLVQTRHRTLQEKVTGLASKVNELDGQLELARHDGATDALTKLYNRKAFDEKLKQMVKMSRLSGKAASLLLIDLDRFKAINDSLGHGAGDVVLKGVADQLIRTFRVRSDFVARYGGDEFAALLWETPLESAGKAAERLLRSLRASDISYQGSSVAVAISIGLTQLRADETEAAWVERTDRALYAAKAGGRNQVVADAA